MSPDKCSRDESVFLILPDDADMVRGFEKVGGGSGLLSMIVPKAQRSFIWHVI